MKNEILEIVGYVNERINKLYDDSVFEINRKNKEICNVKIDELKKFQIYLYTFLK